MTNADFGATVQLQTIRWPLGDAVVRNSPEGEALLKRYESGEIDLNAYRSGFDTLARTLEI
jgi:hypothetical protein